MVGQNGKLMLSAFQPVSLLVETQLDRQQLPFPNIIVSLCARKLPGEKHEGVQSGVLRRETGRGPLPHLSLKHPHLLPSADLDLAV